MLKIFDLKEKKILKSYFFMIFGLAKEFNWNKKICLIKLRSTI